MKIHFFTDFYVSLWLFFPLVFLVWVFVASMVKTIIFAVIKRVTNKTENHFDDLLLEAIDFPVQLLVYASGALIVLHVIPQTEGADFVKYLMIGFKVVCIASGIIFIDKLLHIIIREGMKTIEVLKAAGGVLQVFVRVLVFCIGGLIVLDTFGISITPIIASLGVGSLAVALALQPTLENFFSGVQLIADKPIAVGQMIRLESGEEGVVEKIGWRSTWIAMPNNNTVILPNKMLVNSRVTNYSYPNTEMAALVAVRVHYTSDLEKVERVTIEVAREMMQKSAGGVPGFEPFIRYNALADFSINFNVILRAKDWGAGHLVKHDFIKALQKRYTEEGIVIPYPIRTVLKEG